jgi:hypothetical protein
VKENGTHEKVESKPTGRPRSSRSVSGTVAQESQHSGEGGGGAPESIASAGERVHGVRESAGEYGPPERADEDAEKEGELWSTRYFDTAECRLSYTELS